jgi:hypothetical protein
MAAATFQITQQINGLVQPQMTRRREFIWRLDLNTLGDGTGLVAGESADFGIIPRGFVYEDCVSILRTAEGVAATIDIGIELDTDGFLDGGSVNGTVNALVSKAGNETIARGTYFHADTPIRATAAPASATLDDCILDVIITGFMIERD